jgi:hypothetical protein
MKSILALLPKELLIQVGLDILLAKLNEKPEGKFLTFIKNPKLLKTLNDITEKLKQIQNVEI